MKFLTSRSMIALAAIVIVGVAGLIKGYSLGWIGSRIENQCQEFCAARGKPGQMLPVFPKSVTGGRDGPTECVCR
ncbi:hypothetical protein ACSFA8_24450 [Variovorax sp. RT4R15]